MGVLSVYLAGAIEYAHDSNTWRKSATDRFTVIAPLFQHEIVTVNPLDLGVSIAEVRETKRQLAYREKTSIGFGMDETFRHLWSRYRVLGNKIIDTDFRALENCHVILADLSVVSPGTMMELIHARDCGIPVVAFSEPKQGSDSLNRHEIPAMVAACLHSYHFRLQDAVEAVLAVGVDVFNTESPTVPYSELRRTMIATGLGLVWIREAYKAKYHLDQKELYDTWAIEYEETQSKFNLHLTSWVQSAPFKVE